MESKWSCSSCTYSNWLASGYCAMCMFPRRKDEDSLGRFKGESVRSRREAECESSSLSPLIISQCNVSATQAGVSPSRCRRTKKHPVAATAAENTRQWSSAVLPRGEIGRLSSVQKWSCPLCGCSNGFNANLCMSCCAVRPKKLPWSPSNARCDTQYTLAASGGAVNLSANGERLSPLGETASRASTTRRKSKRAHNRDNLSKAGGGTGSVADVRKWSCVHCTYDNWPRTVRCAMCSKPRTSSPHCSADSSSGESDGCSGAVDEQTSSRRSTVPAVAGEESTGAACANSANAPGEVEKQRAILADTVLQIRNRLAPLDALFVAACAGVIDNDLKPIEAFLAAGGEKARQLTGDEVLLLNSRPGLIHVSAGQTLVHLALSYNRTSLLSKLLTAADGRRVRKRLPSQANLELADEIRDEVASSLQKHKGDWPCYFVTSNVLFILPAEIRDFPKHVRERIFKDIIDWDVQGELEGSDTPVINWCQDLAGSSKLFALWNRTQGDCLLDSLLQATWGVLDRQVSLRHALAESLMDGRRRFFERWRDSESLRASSMEYSLDEYQWQADFEQLQLLASRPGASLEQLHIFALAHILRRPIIVYGIKYVKSFRGEPLDLAHFEGVYLPLLWEASFCWKSPVALGYTRGHFSALVPLGGSEHGSGGECCNKGWRAGQRSSLGRQRLELFCSTCSGPGGGVACHRHGLPGHVTWLPLVDADGKQLPVRFLTINELGQEDHLLHKWLDCHVLASGILAACQTAPSPSPLVEQLLEDWLDGFRTVEDMSECSVRSDSIDVRLS